MGNLRVTLPAFLTLVCAPAHVQIPAEPLFTLRGDAPGDRFGAALAQLGDLDGDGRPDFAVGAPRAAPNGLETGRVRVHRGRDGAVLAVLDGDEPGERFGAALASLGDVDGDGVPDFAVSSPRHGGSRGRVRVYSGATFQVLWARDGAAAAARFGATIAGIGDIDGDGMSDLAVGAPYDSSGGNAAGRVTLHSGATGALLHAFTGQPFDLFGHAVAAAGDYDGDGVNDVWIGAPLADAAAFNAGSAQLRSGSDGSVLASVHGSIAGQQLGTWLVSAGDFDGDGREDLVVGIPGDHGGGVGAGAVEIRSAVSGATLLRIRGHGAGVQLGIPANIGDLDGDGRDDLLVGAPHPADTTGGDAPGRALIVRGPLASNVDVVLGARPRDWYGAAVAGLGDVDGDGVPDFAVGAPGHEDEPHHTGYVRVFSGRRFAGRR